MTAKRRAFAFYRRFKDDEVLLLTGSLAYTTGLAMAPFVIIMLSLVLVTGESFDNSMIDQIRALLGDQAAEAIKMVIQSAGKKPLSFGLSNILEFIVLTISASTIFSQLRAAFDKIDHFQPEPTNQTGLWLFFKERFFCIQLVFGFAFLASTSLLITAGITALLPPSQAAVGKIASLIIDGAVFLGLFTLIFRYIPSSRFPWRRCLISGGFATIFFLIGKMVISLYLGKIAVGSAYGAAGSLVVFLVWVYYSALTLLLSYETTIEVVDKK